MKLFLLCLLVSVSAFAQNVPNAPSWKAPLKDPFFWAGTVFHASSVIADVAHVQACEAAKTCFEANPPSDQYKYRVPEIALIAGADYGCSLMLSGHKWWRAACLALPVSIGILHWKDATHIYKQ
jgi:hypothetical protein